MTAVSVGDTDRPHELPDRPQRFSLPFSTGRVSGPLRTCTTEMT
jgi:hypothetical protein